MTDRMVLRVTDEWAIFADKHQWIVSKARKRGVECDWTPKKFIGSTKTQLLSTLLKMGGELYPEAEAEIEKWPERFLDWHMRQVWQLS